MTKSQSTMYGAKMGFKILLRTWRTIINRLESPITPLVVHWSTKRCKIIKNWSAPKMHFLYTKLKRPVSSFRWDHFLIILVHWWCIGAPKSKKSSKTEVLQKCTFYTSKWSSRWTLSNEHHFGVILVHCWCIGAPKSRKSSKTEVLQKCTLYTSKWCSR